MRTRGIVFLFLALDLMSAQTQPPYHGRIRGTVVDDTGKPFPDALVCFAVPASDTGATCNGPVNRRGEFCIKGCSPVRGSRGEFDIRVPVETTRIFAEKPEAGYMDDSDLTRAGMAVQLTESAPTAQLSLKIGPKPAKLTFNVVAKETRKPIERFTLTWFIMNDDPSGVRYTYSTQRNSVSVPSSRDIMVMVHARGYRHWFYLDSAHGGQPILRFQPGEERTTEAGLESLAGQN